MDELTGVQALGRKSFFTVLFKVLNRYGQMV
jgi:hypothetical protein